MLVAAAREIGAVQIQNRGTLGGNIANGSPAGDTLPVLAAAEALVELRSADWTRKVPFADFYTGLPRERPAAGRTHHGRRGPARRRRAVVPQGRHARGAVDFEGGDGGRARRAAAHRARQRGADRRARAADGGGARVGRVASPRPQRHPAGGDQPDRRHPIDGRLPPRVAANLLAQFWARAVRDCPGPADSSRARRGSRTVPLRLRRQLLARLRHVAVEDEQLVGVLATCR